MKTETISPSLLSFQTATESHQEEVLQFMIDFSKSINIPFELVNRQANLREFLTNPTLGQIWLIQYDQETIGYIALCYGFSFEDKGRNAFLNEVFIHEKFRHQGLGKKVLEFIKKEALDSGIKVLHLEVGLDNIAGNMLYHQFGFLTSSRKLMGINIEDSLNFS